MREYDYLDLKTLSFIGGQISKDDPRFKTYAKLGYERGRQYAAVVCAEIFLKWIKKTKKKDVNSILKLAKKIIEEMGNAELMPTLKELTRITMIQGERDKWIPYSKNKKK